jgi:hypothetical protein
MTHTGHENTTARIVDHMRRARDGQDGAPGESRVVETITKELPQSYIDQLNQIKQALEKFKDSQEFVLPKAFQELVERVTTMEQVVFSICERLERLENKPADITPTADPVDLTPLIERIALLEQRPNEVTEPAELQLNIDTMGRDLNDLAAKLLNYVVVLGKRLDACEARIADSFGDLPHVLAQVKAERRGR